jgi:phage tail sheath protein FI
MPFQLSPGVAVVEKDFTSIVPAVSTSIGGFAGKFGWGPVLEPVTVGSENELVSSFGAPTDNNFKSFFTAANFLSYTNNLLLVRCDATNHKNATASATGGVGNISVGTAGTGYVSTAAAPAVTIGAPNVAGGVQAAATAVLSGGAISAIALTSGGTGYTGTQVVTITPAAGDTGTGATATVTVVSGVITAITVDAGGTGYKATPTVTITGGANTTAAVVGAVTITSSSVTGITVTQAGTGYTSAPAVTVATPPTGTQAVGTASFVTSAGIKINNGSDYLASWSSGQGVVGEFAARYPGAKGNSIAVAFADAATYTGWTVTIAGSVINCADLFDAAPSTSTWATSQGGTNDELHIVVFDKDGGISGTAGTVLEKYAFVSKASDARKSDGTNNFYKSVINTNSDWIWWMDHPTALTSVAGTTNWGVVATGTFKSLTASQYRAFSGGVDDFAVSDANKQNAFALLANAEQYDISLVMAGEASATVASYVISSIAESRLDCVAFVSPQNTSSGDPIIGSTSTEQNAIIAYRNLLPSSSYAVMDSGYKYQYDRYNDVYRYVPLNGDIAGLCARTDYNNDPWFSPGGLNRGQIKNVVRLAFNPNKTQRDMLYKSGVNPVVSFPGEGTVLYGDKTLLAKPSAFDRINVRRLFIVLEKAVATAAKFQLFEFNDPFTRAQFKSLVEPFLRDVQGRRGITDFVVKCDETNNTGQVIDSNQFVADIFVKPNRSINYITLNFVAARSSISFTEIGA